MRAVRLHGVRDLRVEDVPDAPDPVADEVRLTVKVAGICGSDLHNYRTGQWISGAPSVAGHELSGVVECLGDGTNGLSVGDLVAVDSRVWCGHCNNCQAGLHQICAQIGFVGEVLDGGFAEAVTLPARLVQRVSADLDPRHVAMVEPLAVALHALRKLGAPAGEPILIAGCGTIGGFTAMFAARAGHEVQVTDRNIARAELVARVTGAEVIPIEAVGMGPRLVRHAIDATGSVAVIGALPHLLAGGGAIALVGISHDRIDLDPNLLVEREISLIGCHAFADEMPEIIAVLGELGPSLTAFIDDEISLEEIPEAYSRLLDGEARGLKTLIQPRL